MHSSQDIADQLRDILNHTMALVQTICITYLDVMIESHIKAYQTCILSWLGTCMRSCPPPLCVPIVTWHVICMTISHQSHCWSVFTFTNDWSLTGIPGQLEETCLQSFIQGSRIHCWLSRSECPSAIKELQKLFDKHISSEAASDSVLISDNSSPTLLSVPDDLQPLTSSSCLAFCACFQTDGVVYSHCSTHMGNSLIMFYPQGQREPTPDCIKYIFEHEGSVWFAVQHHL